MCERKNCLYFALFLRSTPTEPSSELLDKVACETLFALVYQSVMNSQYIFHCEESYFHSSAFISAGFNFRAFASRAVLLTVQMC
jgi:hypothetical protein